VVDELSRQTGMPRRPESWGQNLSHGVLVFGGKYFHERDRLIRSDSQGLPKEVLDLLELLGGRTALFFAGVSDHDKMSAANFNPCRVFRMANR
jgi:hypothetical protein